MTATALGGRSYLGLLALSLLLGLGGGCQSAAKPASVASRTTPRISRPLNDGWKFIRQEVPAAASPDFDDRDWTSVRLPHTWNLADGGDGGNNYYRGAAWYRLRLNVPAADKGKRLYLRFGAASLVADVYVNGQKAGSHRGGFSAFCFDVTDLIHAGGENVVAVRVDNAKVPDVPPLSGDFTIFGGLYRSVHLLAVEPLHISPLDDGSCGVYLTQRKLDDESATIECLAKLQNDSDRQHDAVVCCDVRDAQGKTLAAAHQPVHVPPGGGADGRLSVTVPKPHRWDGVRDPYLYRVVVSVCERGRVSDKVEQPLGLRTLRIDPQRGLILNGRPYPIHAVNRHQDGGEKGWAAGLAEVERDYKLIREMGCTGVRLCHYQHPEYEYALCDRLGVVAWAELAMVNKIGDDPRFADNAKQQLRELIKQNYNHPSICFWSLFNELALQKKTSPEDYRLVTELNELAHQLDPTRLTTAATHVQNEHPVNLVPDVIGFNRYYGWYGGSPDEWPAQLDKTRAALPAEKAIGFSEYGAGASVKQHEWPTTRPTPAGAWHPEEWQGVVHEAAYGAMKQRPWLWGTYLWCMFDFASDGRHEGDHMGRNDKGLITFDRKTRKDAFYFYKANWSDEPFVHITSQRFAPRPIGRTDVKVYSNCDLVELTVGGQSLGTRTGENGVFVWPGVTLKEGDNLARAEGTRGGQTFTDECTWVASPSATTRLALP